MQQTASGQLPRLRRLYDNQVPRADVEGCGEPWDEQLAQLSRAGVGENLRENANVFAMGQNVAEGGITDDVAEMSMWQRLVVLSVDWLAAQAAEGPSLPP